MATVINQVADVKHLGVDFNLVGPDSVHEIGLVLNDKSGRSLVYTQAAEALTADQPVTGLVGYSTVSGATSTRIDGVAPNAFLVNEFGWIVIQGEVVIDAATSLTLNIFMGYLANGSDQGIAIANTLNNQAPRGVTVVAEAGNKATVRLYG